jgi:uncharacterized protein with von Willebrand factor type A (vWA) domain
LFLGFFLALREAKVPATLREYLTLLEAVRAGCAEHDVEGFYHLARASLVKDERHLDRFDQVFARHFGRLASEGVAPADLPDEWLRKLAERVFSEEEKALVRSLGGFEKLMEELRKRLLEQKERHEGGSKWIGTLGTSPFGAFGFHPEGVRIGQGTSVHRRAVKVWDRREFRDFDDSAEIGTRNLKVALRRLREFVREGVPEELDVDATVRGTARNAGILDVALIPERRNRPKVLLFLDVGGSMDDHVERVNELFSAARAEFTRLEQVYFHNCVYEAVWKRNEPGTDVREVKVIRTEELLRTYGKDHRLVVVGDASMSPYELDTPGGAIHHWNQETGAAWLGRLVAAWPRSVWLNPVPETAWRSTGTISRIREIFGNRMYPLTIAGVTRAMRELSGSRRTGGTS